MKMLQECWASTVIFIGIFSHCQGRNNEDLQHFPGRNFPASVGYSGRTIFAFNFVAGSQEGSVRQPSSRNVT